MKFTVLGGDGRTLHLLRLLRQRGHSLSPYALERELVCTPKPDFEHTDAVLLPLPAEKDGALFAPFSDKRHDFSTIFVEIPPGTLLLGGRISPPLRELCRKMSLPLRDYYDSPQLGDRLAQLSAEAALWLLFGASPLALMGSRVLIYGFGRIGSALAQRSLALGAAVTVCARDPEQRSRARLLGCAAAEFSARPPADFAVNTVPSPHISARELPGCLCLELASPPYGFPGEEIGSAVLDGSALPGRCTPLSAAAATADTILNIMEDEKWKNSDWASP